MNFNNYYCVFKKGLPIYVVDDDIYEKKPSMIISTVDKFARLIWKPNARELFGIDKNGNQKKTTSIPYHTR